MNDVLNMGREQVMIALVRSFFDAFTEGVLTNDKGESQHRKISPSDVKSLLLNHYGNINGCFFDVMFYIISRLTHNDMDEIRRELHDTFAEKEPTVPELMSVACGSDNLYQTMIGEYKNCFSLLLLGKRPFHETHNHVDCNEETGSVASQLAVQLIVRTVVKAYMSGLSISSTGAKAFRYPVVFNIMTCNINCLMNDNEDYIHLSTPEQMLSCACRSDTNMAVALNELNEQMTDLLHEN